VFLQITEYLEPYADRNMHLKAKTNNSAFLGGYLAAAQVVPLPQLLGPVPPASS
jgi:hypothetical protein